jgi:hypothetical protein
MAPLRVLHPPVDCGKEEEKGIVVGLQVAGEEWHRCGVLHPPVERGEEEDSRQHTRLGGAPRCGILSPSAGDEWRQVGG